MAVAFQNVNGTNSSGTTGTTAMPTGITAGDLLISEFFLPLDKNLSISGTGWEIINQINSAGGNYTYGIARKIATASNPSPTWSWDGTNTQFAANCWRFNGVYGNAPIGAARIALDGSGSSTAAGCAAVKATSAAAYMASFCSVSTNQIVPTPTNYTSRNEFHSSNPVVSSQRMSSRALTNGGDDSGSSVVTITAAKWGASLIEIRSQAPDKCRIRMVW